MENERQSVYNALIPKGNVLYRSINREFALIDGLLAFVESHRDSHELENHFNSFAAGLLSGEHSIRVVQVFLRDMPVLVYPIQGNEAVIGRRLMDLVNDERPHVARDVRRALETRRMTLSHPYKLRQGGMGMVARRPVFMDGTLRAIVTVILDIPSIVKDAAIGDDDSGISLAIGDDEGHIFWGEDTLFKQDPIIYPITLPEGEWILAAARKGGWRSGIVSSEWWYRIIGLWLVGMISFLVFIVSARQGRLSTSAAQRAEDLKLEQTKREQAEEWMKIAARAANIGLWDMDLTMDTVVFSPEWKRQIGYEDHEITNDFLEWKTRVHPDDIERCMETISSYVEDPWPDYQLEFRFRHREGHYLWILAPASLVFDNQNRPIRMLGAHVDITGRKKREEAIGKRFRFYTITGRINHIVQRENQRQRLLERSCRLIFEEGGYYMVWYVAPDRKTGRLEPAAWAGVTDGELIALAERQRLGESPMEKSYQTGLPVICNDIETDPSTSTWRSQARGLKCRSYASLPIEVNGEPDGVLNLYAGTPFFFDEEETRLLSDLAQTLSLALNALNEAEQRRQAEQALRDREALLKQTGQIAKIGGWEFNPLTLEGTWTEEVAKIHDLDPKDKTSVDIGLSYYRGEYLEMMERAVREAAELGKPYDLEVELVSAKGIKKWVRAIARAEMVDGKVVKVGGAFQDISDRKAAEEALRDSEERFRTAFESSASGMCLTALDGRYIKVNGALCKMLGYRRDELEGVTHFNQITHPDDTRIGYDSMEKMLSGEKTTASFEKRYLHQDGRVVWVHLNIALFTDNSEQPQYFITQMDDITSRKQNEVALHQYHERLAILRAIDKDIILSGSYEDMINQVLDRIRTLIPCKRIIFLMLEEGSLAGRFFGEDPDTESSAFEVKPMPVPRDIVEQLNKDRLLFIEDHRAVNGFSLGEKFVAGGILTSLFAPLVFSGRLAGVLHLGHDEVDFFTDLHKEMIEDVSNKLAVALNQSLLKEKIQRQNEELEEKIQERTAELEDKNKELETFAYSVSHDLKAPLRGIDGYSRLLQEDYAETLGEEGSMFINNVRQATLQMVQLIDDLLAYSRIERHTWNLACVDLREIVESILAGYADEMVDRRVMVDMINLPAAVSADPDGLNMILRNLLANAFKFTRGVPSPSIEVGGEEREETTLLWVRDNGIGFKMEFHDLIFEIFQRLHRAEDFPGTGVGLAIARKAVERMNGRIWSESKPGQGAVFYFEIPRQP